MDLLRLLILMMPMILAFLMIIFAGSLALILLFPLTTMLVWEYCRDFTTEIMKFWVEFGDEDE